MRIVAHVDMDAFFAAVEERYSPHLRGLPIVIGADPKVRAAPGGGEPRPTGRGVVATANYPARKYGIKSAMPISTAWRLAEAARQRGEPASMFLGGNHRLYGEVSQRIMALLEAKADAFEEASIDEAYLEWKHEARSTRFAEAPARRTKSESEYWREAEVRARALKADILKAEGLTCSVGIGPNKLIAKVASDFKKPDGLTVVPPERVEGFLTPLPIRAIPGIGPKTEAVLHGKGIRTIGELRAVAPAELVEAFGAWGEDLAAKARGISESPVSNEWEPKSVGEQETFERDTHDAAFVLDRASALAAEVFRRFEREGFTSFRTVVITVRFQDFATVSRSHTVRAPSGALQALKGEMFRLLLPFLDRRENPKRKKIRLIGVRIEKLLR